MAIPELIACLACILGLALNTVLCVKLAIRFQEHIKVVRFLMCFVWVFIADQTGQGMIALAGAVKGQPAAEVTVGLHYMNGSMPGTFRKWNLWWPKNPDRANYWLDKAVATGSAQAQATLAEAYMDGSMGLAKDPLKASTYLTGIISNPTADKQTRAEAAFNLYQLFKDGTGVAQNLSEAMRYCIIAADNGSADAAHEVGKAYETGTLGTEDAGKAYVYYKKAVDGGCGAAGPDLSRMKEALGMK